MKLSITRTALLLTALASAALVFLVSCGRQPDILVVYAGDGMKYPIEEIRQNFEQREGIAVNIVYAGSETLLSTIQKTHKGDVFIPGSSSYIKDAGPLITSDQYVALHVPAFAVRAGKLKNYTDLLTPGVRIAVGNKDMAAIGRIAEAILKDAASEQSFRHNIVVTGSTVNELLKLVASGDVDAALVWADMLQWEDAKGLSLVDIPLALNKSKEIRVCTLSTSLAPDQAARFAAYVAGEGRAIFERHGFGKK